MEETYTIVLKDKQTLSAICGANDSNLARFENCLGAPLVCRGNELSLLSSDEKLCNRFQNIIDSLVNSAELKTENPAEYIESYLASISSAQNSESGKKGEAKDFDSACIHIPRGIRTVYPKNERQLAMLNSIRKNDITIAMGAAGTGKTYLAVASALQMLMSHEMRKIILTRPVVEAGESLGFLPGDLIQKITPYLRPLYDAIERLLPFELIKQLEESSAFEVAPLAYMRGRTLHNSVVILDEAQNTTREQMKMFLTRMGDGSKLIVTGDPSQSDIAGANKSGLAHASNILRKIEGIGIVEFLPSDVVRHSLVQKIIKAYG